jgi:DnaJ-class molecular chaperone
VDHYRELQVCRDAEPEVIEKAYRALSLKFHPDRAAPDQRPRATRRMQRINAAYNVLRDPVRRARYDAGLAPETGGAAAWEEFLDHGLVGMFSDWYTRRVRR